MAKDTNKMSTSELIGHLRAGGRFFKAFEHALAAAEFFNDLEKEEAGLKNAIAGLNKEYDVIELSKQTVEKEVEELQSKKDKLTSDIIEIKQKAEAEAKTIIEAAKKEALDLIIQANLKVDAIYEEEQDAINAKVVAETLREKAQADLKTVEKQLQDAKDKFLKAFGG